MEGAMTKLRTDAQPSDRERVGVFVCGMVLGVCLGFATGYVLIWGRLRSNDAHSAGDWFSAEFDPRGLDAPAAGDANRFDLRSLSSAAGHVPGPFYGSAVRRLGGDPPPVDVTGRENGIRIVADAATTAEPDTLPRAVPAEPIDDQTLYREQVTRSIIAEEMPDATPQELDVWFDVLRGLDAADVKGILRMRKHVEGSGPTLPGGAAYRSRRESVSVAETRSTSATPVRPEWKHALACLQEVRDIRLHNLTNADTIGYARQVPLMSEADADAWGVRLAGIAHDWFSGESYYTLNPLDVMVDGMGFLKLRRADEVRLTRCGRLTLDEQRFLALGLADASWRVDPPVQLPEQVLSLSISEDGTVSARTTAEEGETQIGRIEVVTVFNPKALRHTGGGLYALTPACGALQPVGADVKLRQHHVERMSPAAIHAERAALNEIDQLIHWVSESNDVRTSCQPE
jgi:flagellar basal body rod protein FlgG